MTIMEAVRKYLRTYEPLANGRLNVDFLPEKAKTYSVDVVPSKEIVKQYRDGSAMKQFLFVLASREFHGSEIAQNTDNLGFYEAFSSWIEGQSRKRMLPQLAAGKTAQKLEVTTSGYPFLVSEDGTARYQIQMKLTYFEKGV